MDIINDKKKNMTKPVIETKEEYFARLEKALLNLEGENGVSMSEQELDRHFEELLQK